MAILPAMVAMAALTLLMGWLAPRP